MNEGPEAADGGSAGAERVAVCAVDDLPPGDRVIVEVDGRSIGVFNVDGEYHALLNHCPHRGGPVCDGDVVSALVAEWPGPGERRVDTVDGDPAVTCPWHGWEFDLATGVHLGDDTFAVPTFEVLEEDGRLYLRP